MFFLHCLHLFTNQLTVVNMSTSNGRPQRLSAERAWVLFQQTLDDSDDETEGDILNDPSFRSGPFLDDERASDENFGVENHDATPSQSAFGPSNAKRSKISSSKGKGKGKKTVNKTSSPHSTDEAQTAGRDGDTPGVS